MADIIYKNYHIAKKVRDRQIINNLHQYKNISHKAGNSVTANLLPHLGQAVCVDYPGKFNSLKFGTIIKIISEGSIRIKFQDKSIKDIPAKLAHPLIIQELGGTFLNKPLPQPNGQDIKAS